MESKNRVAILAMDPLEADDNQIALIEDGLKRFFGESIPVVQPVFVLNADAAPLPLAWFGEVAGKLESEAKERLRKAVRRFSFVCEEPVVLVEHETSLIAAVNRLNQHAMQVDASLVVVATSAKTRFDRMILGSFAEAMILTAELPLLTISPGETPLSSTQKRTCLCPLDLLHDDPFIVIEPIMAMAQQSGFEIILFTATPPRVPSTHWAHTIVLKELERQLQSDAEEMQNKAESVIQQAKQRGITARFVREEAPRGIPEVISEIAKRDQVAFIAMASKTKKGGRFFTSSITRKLVRMAECPVWIIPPSA